MAHTDLPVPSQPRPSRPARLPGAPRSCPRAFAHTGRPLSLNALPPDIHMASAPSHSRAFEQTHRQSLPPLPLFKLHPALLLPAPLTTWHTVHCTHRLPWRWPRREVSSGPWPVSVPPAAPPAPSVAPEPELVLNRYLLNKHVDPGLFPPSLLYEREGIWCTSVSWETTAKSLGISQVSDGSVFVIHEGPPELT